MKTFAMIAAMLVVPAAHSQGALPEHATPLQIIEWATARAGGEQWLHARSNRMEGWADLDAAHAGTGKFRLDALESDRVIFRISFDGQHSYDQDGPLPPARAADSEASAFGFSAIRFATRPGFALLRLTDDSVDGHPCYILRITDPAGSHTIFGIDRESAYIRLAAWDTPRGWHQRLYSDFYWVPDPGFLQPGRVRLYYAGAKTVDIRWTSATLNQEIADEFFVLGAK
jgi:hypothetical protein